MTVGPILGIVVAFALTIWLLRSLTTPRRPAAPGEVDLAELEAAEREVRDLETGSRPDDEVPGADWGPGTPRPPTRL